jgi:hypothetical protein
MLCCFIVGVVYVYTLVSGAWTLHSKLAAADGLPDDRFGVSLGLCSGGTGALIGAMQVDALTLDGGVCVCVCVRMI